MGTWFGGCKSIYQKVGCRALRVIVVIHKFIAVFVVQVLEVLEVLFGEVLGGIDELEGLPDNNWISWVSSWCLLLVSSHYHYTLHVKCW